MDFLKTLPNTSHPALRLNAICPYFTMFPLQFPFNVLKNAAPTDTILDPFCGRGTSNYAARLRGIPSYGVDSNKVASAIAGSKFFNIDSEIILEKAKQILNETDEFEVPEGEFWELAYSKATLNQICKFRSHFKSKNLSKEEKVLRAIILGILHGPVMKTMKSYLSNQMPRTFSTKPDYSVKYWKSHNHRPKYVSTLQLIKKKAEYFFNEYLPKSVEGKIINADSRTFDFQSLDRTFNWVITSPPYYGMSTYEQDQWLRNWFLGGTDVVDYSSKYQVKHHSEDIFINDLSTVWANTSQVCEPEAKLIIRFGALPSKLERSPAELLKESINLSDVGWEIVTLKKAGKPDEHKRQASQFKNQPGLYIEEFDLYAILRN